MKFSMADTGSGYLIQRYERGSIVVNGQELRESCILSQGTLIPSWHARSGVTLTWDDLQPVLALAPQILILGTGTSQVFPSGEITVQIAREGVGLEVMDTGAACRTYNILVSEGRRAVAALILD
jgi:uncharacterized protein